jgi:hypothetical protein
LTLLLFGDKNKSRSPGNPDKAKPFARRGQKVTGLNIKMAELPKEVYRQTGLFIWAEGV